MRLNWKKITGGLAGVGLAVALAGGAGIAAASGTPGPTTVSVADVGDGDGGVSGGMFGAGNGMSAMSLMMGGSRAGAGGGGMSGMVGVMDAPSIAAAKYLGLTQSELWARLEAGKSLADVASAQGRTVSGLKAAIIAGMTSRLTDDTSLTAAQRTVMLTQVTRHVDAMVTTRGAWAGMNAGGMGAGMMSTGMMGGMGR